MSVLRRLLPLAAAGALRGLAPAAPAATGQAAPASAPPALRWTPCGVAEHVTCTTSEVPRDHDRQRAGRNLELHVARSPATDQAHRIGTLFVNPGGPGGAIAGSLERAGAELLPGLDARFDIIAMDPRGVGQSSPSIDCHADQEREGIYSQPFTTPDDVESSASSAGWRAIRSSSCPRALS